MKRISIAIAAALMMIGSLASCVEEMAPATSETLIPAETVRIRAVIQDRNTKVALGESVEGKTKVEWADGDSFILTVEGTDYTFVRTDEGESTEAEFAYDGQNGTFPETFSAGIVTATYPAVAPVSYATQPGTQASIGQYMTMSATQTVSDGQPSESITLSFTHTTSVVKVTLTNESFKDRSVKVSLSAEGLLDNGKTVTTSALPADSDGSVTAYIGIPVTGDSRTLTDCTISGICNDVPYRAPLGSKDFISGKIYKVSKSNLEVVNYEIADDGTYTVYTAAGLMEWRNNSSSSNLNLGANLTMPSVRSESNWTPIDRYSGIIDGNGKSIIGLSVNSTGTHGGFISRLSSGGIIKNLTLTGGTLSTTGYMLGGIVGMNENGYIIGCRNENSINSGSDFGIVGGIVGENYGENALILACCNTGTITGGSEIGGIAGYNYLASVIASYNTGTISSEYAYYVGGITAYNVDNRSRVISCYSIGEINANGALYIGGIVGSMSDGTLANCYFDNIAEDVLGYTVIASPTNCGKITDGNWSSAKASMNSALAGYTWIYVDNNSTDEPLKIKSTLDNESGNDEPSEPVTLVDLSASGTANSYIVTKEGSYKFKTVKGNSTESVGSVANAKVLWETFGTEQAPNVGDLVSEVEYDNGYITFNASSLKGNALIAAVNSNDEVLWSWHIWMTDQPEEQEYYNNAGVMMDRNLGATSATPGDVKTLGLLYQWGRKDPFLGSSNISSGIDARASVDMPSAIVSDANTGTIEYSIANPSTYLYTMEEHQDWQYVPDETRWTTSEKTIYDPCPVGWRVPAGGENNIWHTASGQQSFNPTYDSEKKSIDFSNVFGDGSIWYPNAGNRVGWSNSTLVCSGGYGYYWTSTPQPIVENDGSEFDDMLPMEPQRPQSFIMHNVVGTWSVGCYTTYPYSRAYASSVRCQKH